MPSISGLDQFALIASYRTQTSTVCFPKTGKLPETLTFFSNNSYTSNMRVINSTVFPEAGRIHQVQHVAMFSNIVLTPEVGTQTASDSHREQMRAMWERDSILSISLGEPEMLSLAFEEFANYESMLSAIGNRIVRDSRVSPGVSLGATSKLILQDGERNKFEFKQKALDLDDTAPTIGYPGLCRPDEFCIQLVLRTASYVTTERSKEWAERILNAPADN